MLKRYKIFPGGLGEININEDENGEWVKYSDISLLIRSETCDVKHVVSMGDLFKCIPCYEYYNCSECDIYQRKN